MFPPEPSRPRVAALLAAAGSGERLGLGPKAFLSLAGSTLLQRAVAALSEVSDEVIAALPFADLARAEGLVDRARLLAGGDSRQETVLALLQATSAELVLVHDVARPFLAVDVARRVLAAAERSGAASAARPVVDSLVRVADGSSVKREELRAVQTPQAFRRRLLLQAHREAKAVGRCATDDAALVRALGEEVELCEGSPWLFKVTTAEDLSLARALAQAWDATDQHEEEGD